MPRLNNGIQNQFRLDKDDLELAGKTAKADARERRLDPAHKSERGRVSEWQEDARLLNAERSASGAEIVCGRGV